jgi:aminoglycoside phosphotransferase family enzyme/predicted kinase
MEAKQHFERICRAMADPTFYPHPVSCLERRETHISMVYLTGPWAYKLKKPVDFGFLDFRTLDARKHFCQQEVLLNQRLSHGIYEGVVPLFEDEGGRISLGGKGTLLEYAVKMKQLRENDSLHWRLQKGEILPEAMKELGRRLADFYDQCTRNSTIDHFGQAEVISFNMEENFRQIEPFVETVVPREPWEFIRQASRAFFENGGELFEKRVREGRIRDGHGDLRAEHIYFSDGIQIIDCIEFNDRFRYGDAIADLAFLHMDLAHLGHAEMSLAFLSAYAEKARDAGLYSLLDFYAAYRAIVKLKVSCLSIPTQGEQTEGWSATRKQAETYLNLAYRYAIQFSRPTLWVFCGLPATGKSSLAQEVAGALHLLHFQSDRFRKEEEGAFTGESHVVPLDEGLYRPEMRHRVYTRMLFAAQERLKKGRSVVLDASYSRRKDREDVRQLADDLDTNLLFIECVCPEEALRERLQQREKSAESLSDARLQHLSEMIRRFEPLEEQLPQTHLRVETDGPFSRSLMEILSGTYALQCLQVQEIL